MSKTMRAIQVDVIDEDCCRVAGLVKYLNDDDVFAYQLSRTSFIAVTEGDCSMALVETIIAERLSEETSITELRR